ncbi:hypothetical protein SAMN05421856_102345 [Chryseobacterium taichungense]|uniref:Lipoprotein n=1 Tax=Chryseobacterium taichungense TaxID=295069 RepID=A0A1H7XCD6_9FLAO|nr:hypothetical protein [Chryseobacterium taichungense]SEM31325.1 hypothetical protein SAMN05421856_102345 [Chryseobacterium taichungense]
MQKFFLLIIILFSLISCYTYQVKKQPDMPSDNKQEFKNGATLANNNSPQTKNTAAESKNVNSEQAPIPINVQEKLKPGKNFKIHADGKTYKIIVDKWESDSLVAHAVHNPKRILKFHKNQINSERIAEKRFSQPIADIITVVVYAGIGVAIYSLIR